MKTRRKYKWDCLNCGTNTKILIIPCQITSVKGMFCDLKCVKEFKEKNGTKNEENKFL